VILATIALSKAYGPIKALTNLGLEIPRGSVYGILGPNGSGKTTFMSIVLNVLKADAGQFTWFDAPDQPYRRRIGSLLETPNFYHYLSGLENLRITQAISGRGDEADIERVLELVKLTERKKSRFSAYSLGMKQRLAIAAALLGQPEVLLLDEPTNGLDPVGIMEIRDLIKELAAGGTTIILASHLLDEVEKVCTHMAILKKGQLLTAGTVAEVLSNEDIVEMGAASTEELSQALQAYPGVLSAYAQDQRYCVHFAKGSADLAQINRFCFEKGIALHHLQLKQKSLESKFFELTND
jgi:ABC-2 type transport system ATP-binding protein